MSPGLDVPADGFPEEAPGTKGVAFALMETAGMKGAAPTFGCCSCTLTRFGGRKGAAAVLTPRTEGPFTWMCLASSPEFGAACGVSGVWIGGSFRVVGPSSNILSGGIHRRSPFDAVSNERLRGSNNARYSGSIDPISKSVNYYRLLI
jgi:hypothetical protein